MKRLEVDREKLSPGMKQYMDIKDQYNEEMLFFRLGDFYELFFEDAIICSRELELTLTSKNAGLECAALYYDAETATEESYAICVKKGNTELLDAINAVLAELGEQGIQSLVKKHLGLEG